MTSITARNSAALKARNGSTLPEAPASKRTPRKAVAKGNKAVAPSNEAPAKPKAAPTPVACHCGCGETASLGRSYRPGHDARHAGMVARAVIEAPIGPSREAATAALKALPPKLQEKANRMISNAAAKAAKQAAARELREAMQAELKAKLAAL